MSEKTITGRAAWIFYDDHFDVDLIIGIKNIKESNLEKLKEVCMKEFEKDFVEKVRPGDILVGGRNFGYGHPHYPAMQIMRHIGISAILAESFSPGFYKGEISNGFPLLACPGITSKVNRWDDLEIRINSGVVNNKTSREEMHMEKLPAWAAGMLEEGGIIPYIKKRLAKIS